MTFDAFYKNLSPLEQGIVDFYNKHRGLLVIENAKHIVEIGSGWGIFTRSVLEANKGVIVTTIDKIPDPKSFTQNTAGHEDRIFRMTGDSKALLPRFGESTVDVVFVDGDHSYKGVKADLPEALRIVQNGGYIILDDVFHAYHTRPEKDYGIFQAASEFCLAHKFCLEVFPVAHGIGLIKVSK